MKDKKLLKKIMIVIIAVAMISTSISVIFQRPSSSKNVDVEIGNETDENEKQQDKDTDKQDSDIEENKNIDMYKEIEKAIKSENGVLETEIFVHDSTVVGTIVVDESIDAEKAKELAQKYEEKMKNELNEDEVFIKIVDKDGNILNKNEDVDMPKASIVKINTDIPYTTYLQVKLETDKPEDYEVIVDGVVMELFTMEGTGEKLFDGFLDEEFTAEQLVPVVMKKQM
jgi:hypothetical protein